MITFGTTTDVVADPPNEYRRYQSASTRSQPGRILAHSEQAVGQNHHPIEQRWFLEPGQATERGGYQIAAREHFSRHLGVAWLIRPNQRQRAETPEIKSSNGQEENEPRLGKRRTLQV